MCRETIIKTARRVGAAAIGRVTTKYPWATVLAPALPLWCNLIISAGPALPFCILTPG